MRVGVRYKPTKSKGLVKNKERPANLVGDPKKISLTKSCSAASATLGPIEWPMLKFVQRTVSQQGSEAYILKLLIGASCWRTYTVIK